MRSPCPRPPKGYIMTVCNVCCGMHAFKTVHLEERTQTLHTNKANVDKCNEFGINTFRTRLMPEPQ